MRGCEPALPANTESIVRNFGGGAAIAPVVVDFRVLTTVKKSVKVGAGNILAGEACSAYRVSRRKVVSIVRVGAGLVLSKCAGAVAIGVDACITGIGRVQAISILVAVWYAVTVRVI